ncbi:hypothetical protein HEM77_021970 [Escherichia coli]|nr:hypothetical protein [Escherichia coli]MBB7402288.1 hypothetical protein [Escherichia coli]
MNKQKIFAVFVFLLTVISSTRAEQIWHFWIPESYDGTAETSVTIDDSTQKVPLYLQAANRYNSRLVMLVNNTNLLPGKSYRRYGRSWVLIPSGWITDPVSKLRYRVISSGGLNSGVSPSGFESYVLDKVELSNGAYQAALYVGYVNSGVLWDEKAWTGELEIDRGSAVPGDFLLSIPVRLGIETNIYTKAQDELSPPWGNIPSVQLQYPANDILIRMRVLSKCSFDSSLINLSHGVMTGVDANGNQTKPYNLNINCTPGTSLSVKFIGAQKIPGKTDNYTLCGDGGMCELTFDNGKYDETMIVNHTKTLSIKSTYHLNDPTKVVAGNFEGSAVLQILVN